MYGDLDGHGLGYTGSLCKKGDLRTKELASGSIWCHGHTGSTLDFRMCRTSTREPALKLMGEKIAKLC